MTLPVFEGENGWVWNAMQAFLRVHRFISLFTRTLQIQFLVKLFVEVKMKLVGFFFCFLWTKTAYSCGSDPACTVRRYHRGRSNVTTWAPLGWSQENVSLAEAWHLHSLCPGGRWSIGNENKKKFLAVEFFHQNLSYLRDDAVDGRRWISVFVCFFRAV